MAQYKTAVIGFGKMGMLHGAQSNIHPDMKLVAVCEKAMFTRSAFKSVMKGVNFYGDYKKLIDKEKPDAVFITTPTFNHHEVAVYAAGAGCAVFCEKPLASTYAQAKEMADAVQRAGVKSFVGFHNRFWPTIAKGKELLDAGAIGTVQSVDAKMYIGDVFAAEEGWRYDPKMSGGGALIDFGIHMVDLLVWYFGDVTSLSCSTKKLYSKLVEDEASASFTFASGLQASFDTSWSKDNFRKASPILTIKGESGEMEVTEQTLVVKTKDNGEQRFTHPDLYRGDYADIAGISYALEMQAFYGEMQGRPSGLDIAHGARIQKIVDDMYTSALEGSNI